jgi:hypothetical protein|tara:strand:- start:399 stop:629 length:231 start_codon:yes stop_codon:yes gene_type:complete
MTTLTKQESRVLSYITNNNSINPLTSWKHCGVYRLSAVIFNLKEKGYNIISTRESMLNQFEESCRFAVYKLGETNE